MKWLPKWVGKVYSKLWDEFRENLFFFEDANKILGKTTPNYLSELKKAQALFIFKRKARKRIYRLVSPNLFSLAVANNLDLRWLKQGEYSNIILLILTKLKENFSQKLSSIGIYGSLARNEAKKDSDIDFFVIFKDLPDSLIDRLKSLRKIDTSKEIQEELKFLNLNSIYPRFSYHPIKITELGLNFFTIDIVFDLKVIYDSFNVLSDFIFEVNKKIWEHKIQRKYLDKNRYYLDLNLSFGEVFKF